MNLPYWTFPQALFKYSLVLQWLNSVDILQKEIRLNLRRSMRCNLEEAQAWEY